MPEGNKSRVSGVGVESNRPGTNLPLGSVGSNQVYRMVKKCGLVPDSSTERGMPVAH